MRLSEAKRPGDHAIGEPTFREKLVDDGLRLLAADVFQEFVDAGWARWVSEDAIEWLPGGRDAAQAHTLCNGALRSAWQVAEREGRETNWPAFRASLRESLDMSHMVINALADARKPNGGG